MTKKNNNETHWVTMTIDVYIDSKNEASAIKKAEKMMRKTGNYHAKKGIYWYDSNLQLDGQDI
jgi:hypothetical protein